MASSETPPGRRFRRGLLGYRRFDVDSYIEQADQALRDEVDQLRERAARADDIGKHLASLLVRFAEAISAGEQEAREQADKIVADAESRAEEIKAEAGKVLTEAEAVATATFQEAGRRYGGVTAAHAEARERIEDAIERLAHALASLKAVPEFPASSRPTSPFLSENVVRFQPPAESSGDKQPGSVGH